MYYYSTSFFLILCVCVRCRISHTFFVVVVKFGNQILRLFLPSSRFISGWHGIQLGRTVSMMVVAGPVPAK